MAEFNELQVEDLKRVELCEKLIAEGVTGQIYNVVLNEKNDWDARWPNISGHVIVDTRNRFWGGDFITTSRLEKIYTNDEGRTFAKTLYSTYELIDFDIKEIPEDFRYAFS